MKKKIIVLLSFLSASGLSWISYKVISQDSPRQNVSQKRKEEDSPEIIPDDHQEKNYFWLGIIIGIILFLFIAVIIYVFIKRNKNSHEEDGDSTHSNNLSNKIPNGAKTNIETKPNIIKTKPKKVVYDNWIFGVVIQDNKMQLVLSEKWDADTFVKQIFHLDVESKTNLKNEKLKKIYQNANSEVNKNEIIKSLSSLAKILNYVKIPFLKKIISPEFRTSLNLQNKIDSLQNLIINFDQEIKKNPDQQIILTEINIKEDDQEYAKCPDDFNHENFWTLFKTIMNKDKPVAYEGDHLFEYTYRFYQLIKPLKEYLYDLCQYYLKNDGINKTLEDNAIDELMFLFNEIDF